MSTPTKNAITISIPEGKVVIVNFATNSSMNQSFNIADSNGHSVCSGSGTGTGPAVQASQTFTAVTGGNYTVTIKGGGSEENVLTANCSAIDNGVIYAQSFVFVGEDAGDHDFNDTFLSINWFQFNG